MVAADECPLGAAVPLPAGFVAPVSWFVEKLAVGDLRCAARVECESGACASVESGKPLIVCMPGLARNLVHVRSPDRRWLGDLARNGATRCNGRFPKSDPFEFRPVAKRLVSHGDDRDSQAEQRISSCGIRGDALGSGVLGIAVVLNSELCLLPIEVAKEIASIERLLLCCVERDEAV